MTRTPPDGTVYAVRPVRPADEAALAALVQRFSPETMRAASCRPSGTALPPTCAGSLPWTSATTSPSPWWRPRTRRGCWPSRAACASNPAGFAIAAADEHQRQGLGTVLASALAEAADAARIRRFAATTLAENDAAVRLMRTFAARLHDGGVRELTLDLAA